MLRGGWRATPWFERHENRDEEMTPSTAPSVTPSAGQSCVNASATQAPSTPLELNEYQPSVQPDDASASTEPLNFNYASLEQPRRLLVWQAFRR